MSTLLIGGNGLIGTRLSAYLADHGEEVFSYSLHSPSQKHPGVHYIQGDVTDYGTLNMLLKQNHIDSLDRHAVLDDCFLLLIGHNDEPRGFL